MTSMPVDFNWHVAENGYRWLEDVSPAFVRTGGTPPFLTEALASEQSSPWLRQYRPLEEFSGLFRVFAGTELTRVAILAFANRFGPLGGKLSIPIPIVENAQETQPIDFGEELHAWGIEIRAMWDVVKLWDLVRKADHKSLQECIVWWEKPRMVVYEPPVGTTVRGRPIRSGPAREITVIAGENLRSDLFESFRPGDVVEPAYWHLRHIVNERLKDRASARLLQSRQGNRPTVNLIPTGLIGALWLQCAQAIENGNEFRQCAECGLWFELTPRTARVDKIFCSSACRTRAYRKRQSEVAELHQKGMRPDKIARQLELDEDTVRQWITKGVRVRTKRRGRPPKAKS
jgi:hypothetical protein